MATGTGACLSVNSCFDYAESVWAIRAEIVDANRRAWDRLARPGNWWTGVERVAIAAEVRNAHQCSLCAQRRQALSPEAVQGEHDDLGQLSAAAVDAIHRIVTDPGRLTRTWYERVVGEKGISEGHYVELLGATVTVLSIDAFHRGLALDAEPLPEPQSGDPSRYRPELVEDEGAYVPMLPVEAARGAEEDLWEGQQGGNVTRAMSLVPDAVRELVDLSAAYYLPLSVVASPTENADRSLNRGQIELLAARVSALNECFY